jgi:hypothetical protein
LAELERHLNGILSSWHQRDHARNKEIVFENKQQLFFRCSHLELPGKLVNRMTEHDPSSKKSLYRSEFLENHGDFAGAYRVILEAMAKDPGNADLDKKRKELLDIICWRC